MHFTATIKYQSNRAEQIKLSQISRKYFTAIKYTCFPDLIRSRIILEPYHIAQWRLHTHLLLKIPFKEKKGSIYKIFNICLEHN